jgi:hypothetical protein
MVAHTRVLPHPFDVVNDSLFPFHIFGLCAQSRLPSNLDPRFRQSSYAWHVDTPDFGRGFFPSDLVVFDLGDLAKRSCSGSLQYGVDVLNQFLKPWLIVDLESFTHILQLPIPLGKCAPPLFVDDFVISAGAFDPVEFLAPQSPMSGAPRRYVRLAGI